MTYNVVVWYGEGYHYDQRNVTAERAVAAAKVHTESVGARTGLLTKIMITDADDYCTFEWRYGEGVVFPTKEQCDDVLNPKRT